MAALKGAAAGAVLGFLGGKPLNLPALENSIWIGAVTGAVVGVVAVVFLVRCSRRDGEPALALTLALTLVPGFTALGALAIGFKKLAGWAFGWAVAQGAEGYVAAGLGAVAGGGLAASVTFLMSRDREMRRDAVPSRE